MVDTVLLKKRFCFFRRCYCRLLRFPGLELEGDTGELVYCLAAVTPQAPEFTPSETECQFHGTLAMGVTARMDGAAEAELARLDCVKKESHVRRFAHASAPVGDLAGSGGERGREGR